MKFSSYGFEPCTYTNFNHHSGCSLAEKGTFGHWGEWTSGESLTTKLNFASENWISSYCISNTISVSSPE